MSWTRELKAALPREEIPKFLHDLQALVKALRDKDEDWRDRVTDRLRGHPELVVDYMQPSKNRDAVEKELKA